MMLRQDMPHQWPAPRGKARACPKRSAAPTGGALSRGWGRAISTSILILCAIASVAQERSVFAEPVPMASGLDVTFHDVIQDAAGDGLTYRFRFVVPQIAQEVDFLDVAPDMERLCSDFALPRVPQPGPKPRRIVISFMSEPTEFGVANPDVIQYFESYSVENARCIWEVF